MEGGRFKDVTLQARSRTTQPRSPGVTDTVITGSTCSNKAR